MPSQKGVRDGGSPIGERNVRIKRVYDAPAPADGTRILVDRLWPRGLKKERAKVDLWMKDVAPSPALRQWFGHDPKKWAAFKKRYWCELADNDAVGELRRLIREGQVALLYAARDTEHNHALALLEFLRSRS